jgi:protein-tyrosine phosphatase
VSDAGIDPVFRVLLVCTGNICRSAFAERLGRAWLDETFEAQPTGIQLASAGTRAVVGSGMHPDTALVLAGYGANAGDFRARQLSVTHLAEADLILTMTRAHRRDVLALAPRGLARTFTLREAAALLELVDGGAGKGGDTVAARARGLVAALADTRPRRPVANDDEVPDPINQSVEGHAAAGELIVGALLPLLRRLVGPA